MNKTLETILNRRSVRKFTKEQIKDEELQTILEAGKYAPSAMNQQSWHITAVQNKEVLQKINDAFKTAYANSGNKNFEDRAKTDHFSAFYDAPTYVMVFGDDKAIAPKHDGSLAMENMFLAAESLGIGSCWIHAVNFLFNSESGKTLKKELGIPESYSPVGSGAFGYKAAASPAAAPRKEGTVNIIR
jgi:nitroreductase